MKIQFLTTGGMLKDCTDGPDGRFYRKDLAPGTSVWDATGHSLLFVCPCGCSAVQSVPVVPPATQGWQWNQNRELPTLTPSIDIKERDGRTSHWHGYLTNGEWVKC